ncbi:hypothetical protein WJ0W_005860 [Paenibacillus melissococcoides]|uniref:Uncharacterized protein n=1 Tax=Paenibacillus melissococcoides TaxID=2912268 RepID=A0ABN8UGJ3_9BACL|nr:MULTISPECIES: hypothetical protein [Paenibacillus]MEB9893960.1 hypothetical protein [Bacillus cereus]CAH8248676.1 hypothetical protein WJ0W_005860 [Paenibacillus melissococcoides]CAH8714058.1 hypothetical protein WDD9_003752 [Paenibacillus melissococcoides]CAH8720174.1 hypothetical protein HTL2_005855 [Paenibacillus melissococcoides]
MQKLEYARSDEGRLRTVYNYSLFLKVYATLNRVDVALRLHKDSVWLPENVYVALPFTNGHPSADTLYADKAGELVRPWTEGIHAAPRNSTLGNGSPDALGLPLPPSFSRHMRPPDTDGTNVLAQEALLMICSRENVELLHYGKDEKQ